MSAKLLSGTEISRAVLDEVRTETERLQKNHGKVPGLVTLLVGDNPASVSYVARKVETARSLGFHEIQDTRPATLSQAQLLQLIQEYNVDPAVHGILVQLPLPTHIDEATVIRSINPNKDVDGFHPLNLGRMICGDPEGFAPCTPAGIKEMLLREQVSTCGAEVVIVGRSNTVGRPLSILLGQKGPGGDATVTLLHSRSVNLRDHCRRADILVAAAGMPGFIKADWVRPGAVVIDVGVNRVGFNPQTGKAVLRGDVDFEQVRNVAGSITPVPGGVGPMTIAMLMKNTLIAAQRHLEG